MMRSWIAERKPASATAFALACCAGIAISIRPALAHACGALACDQRVDYLPSDGSHGVPLNTELRIRVLGYLKATDNDGQACDAPFEAFRLVVDATAEPVAELTATRERTTGP